MTIDLERLAIEVLQAEAWADGCREATVANIAAYPNMTTVKVSVAIRALIKFGGQQYASGLNDGEIAGEQGHCLADPMGLDQ